MDREVFQSNNLILFLIIGSLFAGMTIAYFQADLPIWVLPIVLVIGIFIIFSSIRTKLVVEDGQLRYEKLIGKEEVELKRVSQIVVREIETIVNKSSNHDSNLNQGSDIKRGSVTINSNHHHVDQERKIEKYIYILDEAGQTFFSLPANLVSSSQKARFREVVHAVNPNIEVF